MFKNGLTWLKVDFHLHTRKDKEFTFSGAENSFVKTYISKLKAEEISVGVIANHNKFDEGEVIEPIDQEIMPLMDKNRNLAAQRDMLLPHLMSGKLEV